MSIEHSRRWSRLAVTAIVAVVVAVPTAVWAGHQFTDVPDDHPFHTGITWMKDNNITVGCNPPANTEYCPDDNVTRGQMATFMKRLAENNVVDAATLDGHDSTDFVPVITVLSYTGANTEASPTFQYELIRTVGTFTKQSNDTTIRLDWSAHHRYVGTDGTDFCHYQLRVDGFANDGDNALNFQGDQEGNAVSYAMNAPIATFAEFDGLGAGDHTVGVYVRGSATSCTLNSGNFNQQVVVEEYTSSELSTLDLAGDSDDGSAEGGE